MKGSPIRDFCLVFICFLFLLIPLRMLTRFIPTPGHAPDLTMGSAAVRDAWLDLRFSHAPMSIKVFQNGELLLEGGGALRLDADILLNVSEARSGLQLEFRWPEDVAQAYVELQLEPDGMPSRSLGFWASGLESRTWNLSWDSGDE